MDIKVSQELYEMLLISAERYALGRATYVVGETVAVIKSYIPRATDNFLSVLDWDFLQVEERAARYEAENIDHNLWGMKVDKAEWVSLIKAIREEMGSRGLKSEKGED